MALNLNYLLVPEWHEFTQKGNGLICKICSAHGGEILDYNLLDCGVM